MVKDIVIAGAGGTALETALLIERINAAGGDWNIKGFLCDDLHALDHISHRYEIIGTIKEYVPAGDEQFAAGISMPESKYAVVSGMLERGCRFATLLDPAVNIPESVTVGYGSIVMMASVIAPNVRIGNFVTIQSSMIGAFSVLGDYSTTTGYSNVACAELGERVFVGSHAVILNHIKVGSGSTIGAGCIISRNVGENKVAFCQRPKIVEKP